MAKLVLTDITGSYASVAALNANFALIETSLENTLSRDGTTPNTMSADLDLNSHDLLNVQRVNAVEFVLDGELLAPGNLVAESASQLTFTPAGTGAVLSNVQAKLREKVSFKDFGANLTNAANNVAALALAVAYCESNDKPLDFDGATYPMTGTYNLPGTGITGTAIFSGGIAKWSYVKHTVVTGTLECDELILDSVWHMEFDKIRVVGNITIQSSNATWGSFWNHFSNIYCGGTLILDVDQGQSVNQNVFDVVVALGGLHIKGVAVSGIREAYNNIFLSLDTTGANLTAVDATTGWHVLNDSVLNQTNSIHSWDAEVSGNMGIAGNWNILNPLTDSVSTTIAITERNHSLFSVGKVERNDGDFFAGGVNNLAVGGEWDVLNSTFEYPYCFSTLGTTVASTKYGATSCPSQINQEYSLETSSAFSGFIISLDCPSQQTVTMCMWYQGDAPDSIVSDGGTYCGFIPFAHSSGWKLARIIVPSATSYITFYMNDAGTSYKRFSINSIFATASKTAMLPTKKDGPVKVRGTIVLPALGGTGTIPLPNAGFNRHAYGTANIGCYAPPVAPYFNGLAGSINCAFSKTYFGSDYATVLGTQSIAMGQLNGGSSLDVVATGSTTGILLTGHASLDECTVNYELVLQGYLA
jgi:hypothetical protein